MNRLKIKLSLASFALCLVLLLIPSVRAQTTVTWYFREDTHTVNGVTGYVVNETVTAFQRSISDAVAGDVTVQWGWRVWQVLSDNSTSELTSGTPVAIVSRSSDGSGMQNATWGAPSASLRIGFDALRFIIYMKFGAAGWLSKVTFISHELLEKTIVAGTWTFRMTTQRLYSGGNTIGYFVWGNGVQTRLEGLQFVDPNVYEHMNYKLLTRDFVGFILHPYVNLVGNLFYGIFMLILCVPLYNRYRSFTPILLFCIVIGGAAGVFTILVPVAGLGISWVFFLFGIAGLLYKVFR